MLEKLFRLSAEQKEGLRRLGISTVHDLLFYFPSRYVDIRTLKPIKDLVKGENVSVAGKVTKVGLRKAWRKKTPLGEAEIEDVTGKIKIVWFHQPYIAKIIKEGEFLKLSGRISDGKKGLYLANPEFERIPTLSIDTHDSLFEKGEQSWHIPIYPETRELSSRWFHHAIKKILSLGFASKILDYIPGEILKKYNLPAISSALFWIHLPKNPTLASAARKRFAFDEVFLIQIKRALDRQDYQNHKAFKIEIKEKEIKNFVERFSFELTGAQERAIKEITLDLNKKIPMARLLEGDVGSGKTAVAAAISYAIINTPPEDNRFGRLQIAFMAPTEILAEQHFNNFISHFKHLPISIGLITGSGCKKFPSKINPHGWTTISRNQLLKWIADGSISILLGTHALIQKTVQFKNLGLCVIDEQHRFGTRQRMALVRKDNIAPHLLSMTATPIPRTLALTIYGDLDLTLLDEMPKGRREIITEIIPPEKRESAYEKIREEIEKGRQVYVVCPRIEEGDGTLDVKSVKTEAKRLKEKVFPKERIEILHSRLKKDEKEKTMKEFAEGKIQILVATSVIEVGINVPNATVMVIEGAERFGLAQLHQLRGRVNRSTEQAYCFIFAQTKSPKTLKRLEALKTAKNGFELSEMDLALRGPGELAGAMQSGLSDLAMEAIKNLKMVEAARNEAQAIIMGSATISPKEMVADPLKNYPLLKETISKKTAALHFE